MSEAQNKQAAHGHRSANIEPLKAQSLADIQKRNNSIRALKLNDGLKKTRLTLEALRELNRGTRSPPRPSPYSRACLGDSAVADPHNISEELVRLSKNGGLDLNDLRGYPCAIPEKPSTTIGSKRTLPNQLPCPSKGSDIETTTSKIMGQHKLEFDVCPTDHGVSPTNSSPPDLEELKTFLTTRRPSSLPSNFTYNAFEAFLEEIEQAKTKEDVMKNVLPTILGPDHDGVVETLFTKLDLLEPGPNGRPTPDVYYGAPYEQLNRSVCLKLTSHIEPTADMRPIVPNFFVEFSSPRGDMVATKSKTRYEAAFGTRAMHSLQNYGKIDTKYDAKAYTFSCTYNHGHLQMYAHHCTAPNAQGSALQYQMTRLAAFSLLGSYEQCIEGLEAFNNLRDWAKLHRDRFIQAANDNAALDFDPLLSSATVGSQDDILGKEFLENGSKKESTVFISPHLPSREDSNPSRTSNTFVTPDQKPLATSLSSPGVRRIVLKRKGWTEPPIEEKLSRLPRISPQKRAADSTSPETPAETQPRRSRRARKSRRRF